MLACFITFWVAVFLEATAESEGAPAWTGGARVAMAWVWLLTLVAAPLLGILSLRQRRRLQAADQRQQAMMYANGLAEARSLTADLMANIDPPPLTLWGVVLEEGERAYFDLPAHYARFYGQNVSYQHVNGVFAGTPGFVAAGLAMAALGNAARRNQAQAAAMRCWRDQQFVRVIATDRRLICLVYGQWMSFDHGAVTAFYPEIENQSMVLEFETACPLALFGPTVPLLTVYTTARIHGRDALRTHPALAALHPDAAH